MNDPQWAVQQVRRISRQHALQQSNLYRLSANLEQMSADLSRKIANLELTQNPGSNWISVIEQIEAIEAICEAIKTIVTPAVEGANHETARQ